MRSDELWPKQMDASFGPNGEKGELGLEFPVQPRRSSPHGPWTFAKSKEMRPQQSGSVYTNAQKVTSMAINTYTVLAKKLIGKASKNANSEELPSGWTGNEELLHLMMYNLYLVDNGGKPSQKHMDRHGHVGFACRRHGGGGDPSPPR